MRIIADLQIHSRFARACSKNTTLPLLEKWARIKGISLLGTGDFTHPVWSREIKEQLTDDGSGILYSKTGYPFLCQSEVSLMYSAGGRGRRVHLLMFAPSFDVVTQITDALKKRGRVDYDGRPIFNITCPEFVDLLRSISPDTEVVPAHSWTPWFGIFGSKSGFNSLQEAFGDRTKYIHAIETGLSSSPEMNWRLSQLDNINIVSFSDCHSYWPWRLGREVTLFDTPQLSYNTVLHALRTGEGLAETWEVDPAYGKYHWDGHRLCNIVLSPEESKKVRNLCPKCGQPLVIGVENRVLELADRPSGHRSTAARPFRSLIPLSEIISLVHGGQPSSKPVWEVYNKLIAAFGNEFSVLNDAPVEKIAEIDPLVAQAIQAMRAGTVTVKPGYDGVYGVPQFPGLETKITSHNDGEAVQPESQQKPKAKQRSLGEF